MAWPTVGCEHICIQIRGTADESAAVTEEEAIRLISAKVDAHQMAASSALQLRNLRRLRQQEILERYAQRAIAPFRFMASRVLCPFLRKARKAGRLGCLACRSGVAAAERQVVLPLTRFLCRHSSAALRGASRFSKHMLQHIAIPW